MKYLWHDGQWVEALPSGGGTAAPAIISDHMAPLRHPVSGQVIDSKSLFRRATREAGCVELGNDAPAAPSPPQRDASLRTDLHQAWQKLEQGYRPTQPPMAVRGDVRMFGR
jgi:hypothetical protein